MKIPPQLQNPEFRFFLVVDEKKYPKNPKKPLECKWNSINCYHFFDEKLLNYNGNYGICTGFGNLIVLDFDDSYYYNSIADKLPPTFTVLSAGKRLPHLYYILNDQIFKKIAVRDNKNKVLCDIQANRNGIIGPGSIINRRVYTIVDNRKISEISLDKLKEVFGLSFKPKNVKEYTGSTKDNPKKVEEVVKALVKLRIKRMGNTLFQCFKHDMEGNGNLSVMGNGRIWCFHCLTLWKTIEEFIIDLTKFRRKK